MTEIPEGDDQIHRLNRFREKHPEIQAPKLLFKEGVRLGCGHDLEMLLDSLEAMEL